ncbi:MAG: integrase arm-type DNA-binding domain-containing protein [Pseudomonadota bacterium]
MGKLTEATVRTSKPGNTDRWLGDGSGLYLRVRIGGSKVWVIRRKQHGRTQIITLGNYPTVKLKQARLKAAEYQLRQDVSNVTVDDLITKYVDEIAIKTFKRPELSQGYFDRAVSPAIGHRKVRDVSRIMLVEIIQAYAKRGARTADQLRSNLKKLFGYAVELGYIESNPMNDVSRRVAGYTPVARDRVLSDDEIRLIWQEPKANARTLRFLLLTGLRISEAQQGHQDGDRWIVPAELSKNGRAHWVHLTPAALDQLPLPACTTTNVQSWLERWCGNHKIVPRFTPHDGRRMAATRMNNNGIQPFIVERVLNYTLVWCNEQAIQQRMAILQEKDEQREAERIGRLY